MGVGQFSDWNVLQIWILWLNHQGFGHTWWCKIFWECPLYPTILITKEGRRVTHTIRQLQYCDTIIVIGIHSTVTQGIVWCAQFHINNYANISCHGLAFECECLKLSSESFSLITRDPLWRQLKHNALRRSHYFQLHRSFCTKISFALCNPSHSVRLGKIPLLYLCQTHSGQCSL